MWFLWRNRNVKKFTEDQICVSLQHWKNYKNPHAVQTVKSNLLFILVSCSVIGQCVYVLNPRSIRLSDAPVRAIYENRYSIQIWGTLYP